MGSPPQWFAGQATGQFPDTELVLFEGVGRWAGKAGGLVHRVWFDQALADPEARADETIHLSLRTRQFGLFLDQYGAQEKEQYRARWYPHPPSQAPRDQPGSTTFTVP